uniref:Uncharacterized protein n=1 Tax=Gasterosteus aculeatus aculeatus TaxID=481459 RepID=A0AAQ4NXF8_GASAC
MLGGRSALASVFLCFVCLLGPTPPAAGICTTDLPKQVKSMIKIAPRLNHLGSRLYTQTATDFQQNCIVSTLKCFSAEMDVLINEWKLANVKIPQKKTLVSGLKRLADRFSLAKNTEHTKRKKGRASTRGSNLWDATEKQTEISVND